MSGNNKSACREYALQFLFQFISQNGWPLDGDAQSALNDFEHSRSNDDNEWPRIALNPNEVLFAQNLALNVWKSHQELEKALSPLLQMPLERCRKIDLAILLVASSELSYVPDTPKAVVIDEAVKLAKKYGEAKSPQLINAILDRYSKGLSK